MFDIISGTNAETLMSIASDLITPTGAFLVGGASADQFRMVKSFEYINNEVVSNGAAFLMIYGDVEVSTRGVVGS